MGRASVVGGVRDGMDERMDIQVIIQTGASRVENKQDLYT